MDITTQIIIDAPSHDLSYNAQKAASRYQQGDIVQVYLTADVPESPNPNSRLGFIRITGTPTIAVARVNEVLHRSIVSGGTITRKREWVVPFSLLTAQELDDVVNSHEVTITWTRAKELIRRKSVTSATDPTQDDTSHKLTESDLL